MEIALVDGIFPMDHSGMFVGLHCLESKRPAVLYCDDCPLLWIKEMEESNETGKIFSETFQGNCQTIEQYISRFGSDLLFLAKNPWAKFSTLEVSRDLINLAIQKTVDKLQLGIVVTLNDTKECACMFELVQLVYMKKFGPKKWASREIKSISLATLIDQHLLADWELYQPHSAFRHHNSIA